MNGSNSLVIASKAESDICAIIPKVQSSKKEVEKSVEEKTREVMLFLS